MQTKKMRNSGRSGPTSIEGKAICSTNAIRHGLDARSNNLLPFESFEEFTALAEGVFKDWEPVGTCEEAEVWRIINLLLRGQRAERFESGSTQRSYELNTLEANKADAVSPPTTTNLGRISSLPHLANQQKLTDVESHLARQLDKTYRRLEFLQARRIAKNTKNPETNLDERFTYNGGML